MAALAVPLVLAGGAAACSEDAADVPRRDTTTAPDRTEPAPGTDVSPRNSTPPTADGGDGGSTVPGAVPGQDIDDLDPPGGTVPVPDPGGDGATGRGSS